MTASMSRVRPSEPCKGKGHHRFIGGVHRPFDHSLLRREPAPKLRIAPVPDSLDQDVYGAWTLRSQTVHYTALTIGYRPFPGLNVDSDVFSKVVGFDLGQDVPLVYLPAEACRLFAGAARRAPASSRGSCIHPLEGVLLLLTFYRVAGCSGNEAQRPANLAAPLVLTADAGVKWGEHNKKESFIAEYGLTPERRSRGVGPVRRYTVRRPKPAR